MVACVKEIEELLSAVLLGGGPRADSSLTLLQPLLGVDTMLYILTLLSHWLNGILKHTVDLSSYRFFFLLTMNKLPMNTCSVYDVGLHLAIIISY